jgi:hypothetical protein
MTYIYSLCDDICGQDIRTLTRLEKINRTLSNGVNAPHLEHRFKQTCSGSPSPSQSSYPPFTSRSPRRNTIFLPVPYLVPKPQAGCNPCVPFLIRIQLCRVLILPDPPRCGNDPTCVCANDAFTGAAYSCVWQSCSNSDAQTATDYWATVCGGYGPSSGTGNHSLSFIHRPILY